MKNEYKITKKLMMTWANDLYLYSPVNIFLSVLWYIIGACGLLLLIINIAFGADFIDWFLSIIFILLAVFKLFFSRFIIMSRRYNIFSKTYGVSEWIRTTEFTDNEIIVTDHNSINKFRYANVNKIKEKNNLVIIFLDSNLVIRIYKNAFVEGSWDECAKMLGFAVK